MGARPEPASTGPGAGRSTGDRAESASPRGLAGALGLSWLFPVSTARLAEPSPGIRFDPIVHLGGSLLLVVVLGLSTAAIACERSTAGRWVWSEASPMDTRCG